MNELAAAPPAVPAEQFDDARQQAAAATLGMWVFLATEVLFLGVLFAGYAICRVRHPLAFAAGSRHTDLLLGSIETAILLVSSFLAALAVRALEMQRRHATGVLLCATAALGLAFLLLHGVEYRHEYHEALIPGLHYAPEGQPPAMALFFFLYYAITGFHGLHVLIGVVLLLVMARRVFAGRIEPAYAAPLEVATLYWHLVDIVWIFVYPLLYLVARAG